MSILASHTQVSAERTATEIQAALVRARASAVLTEYSADGVLTHLSFRVDTRHGVMTFRLPANVDGVHSLLAANPTLRRTHQTREHAARVAWRICKAWVVAQLAVVEAGMAELPEVFLPYAQHADGKTVWERVKRDGLPALGYDPSRPPPG